MGGVDMSTANAARLRSYLQKQVRFRGAITTREAFIRTLCSEGFTLEQVSVNVVPDMTRAAFNRANGRQQDAHERRQRLAGKRTETRAVGEDGVFFTLTPMEAQFFRSISAGGA